MEFTLGRIDWLQQANDHLAITRKGNKFKMSCLYRHWKAVEAMKIEENKMPLKSRAKFFQCQGTEKTEVRWRERRSIENIMNIYNRILRKLGFKRNFLNLKKDYQPKQI